MSNPITPPKEAAHQEPDISQWLKEAKQDPDAASVGMYLTHNGVVRAIPKKVARADEYSHDPGCNTAAEVIAVDFSYDKQGLEEAISQAYTWEGVYYVRVWLNEGRIAVGGSLMYVLIGADIRPHAIDALVKLVGHIKNDLVKETEIYAS